MANYEMLHVLKSSIYDANNVSNFGGEPVTQLNLKKAIYGIIYAVLRTWRSIAVTRSQFLRRLLRDHAQTAAVLYNTLFSREEIFAKSEFEIFSREDIFANISLLFTRKYLPAKISSRENNFPRKFLPANFFP